MRLGILCAALLLVACSVKKDTTTANGNGGGSEPGDVTEVGCNQKKSPPEVCWNNRLRDFFGCVNSQGAFSGQFINATTCATTKGKIVFDRNPQDGLFGPIYPIQIAATLEGLPFCGRLVINDSRISFTSASGLFYREIQGDGVAVRCENEGMFKIVNDPANASCFDKIPRLQLLREKVDGRFNLRLVDETGQTYFACH